MKEKMEEIRNEIEFSTEDGLYSTEVQELMGKIPPTILRVGIISIFMLVVTSFLLCCFVKMPETITFPIKLSNVNVLEDVKTGRSGNIVASVPEKKMVYRGDTLLLLVDSQGMIEDTICIQAPISGIAYACAPLVREEFVSKGTTLFFMVDTIKDKIVGIGDASVDLKYEMEKNMKVEAQLNGQVLQGKVNSVARYANPLNGTYAINFMFDYPKEMEKKVVWNNRSEAKITVKDQTVMEKIFPLLRMIKDKRR